MHFGICPYSVVPIRTSSSHKSEQASQLLFGELVELLETKGRQWTKVRCLQDNLVGWLESHQVTAITPSEKLAFQNNFAFNLELVQAAMGDNYFVPITLGARLPNFDGIHFKLGEMRFTFSGQAIDQADLKTSAPFLIKIAKRYLNAPFQWGGRSPFGIDAAGLVQVLFSMVGQQLPRDPEAQIDFGSMVDFIDQAREGDLAFFENKNGRIAHVGIIMKEQYIIHAYGAVRIDRLDHYGIYNEETKRYTHKLRVCKRLLPLEKDEWNQPVPQKAVIDNQVEMFKH
ncbi:MAG TPA: C40 family peptidase [Saprospiraceae bacterium]|nr:C40 family peptidase [Saprospiraceae bacterium]